VGPPDSPVVHRTGTVHCPVRLLAPALTSARAGAHCLLLLFICRRPLARSSRCSAGTPDSPVNYSGVASQIPKAGKFELILPGAPDSPVRQTRATFGLSLILCFEPFLRLRIGLC
jgi:hypothetical protein